MRISIRRDVVHGSWSLYADDVIIRITPAGSIQWCSRKGYLAKDQGPCVLLQDGHIEWREDGYYHRRDQGPQVIAAPGGLLPIYPPWRP